MSKVIIDFGVAGLAIGDLTWHACQKVSDNSAVATTSSTLTAYDATGKYWLENPNVTADTQFAIYITATPTTKRLGMFRSPTSINICNRALLGLGQNVITSLSDTSTEGVLCNALWASALDAVIRLHPWNFAVKRATLTPDATAPVYEWTAAFSIPSDCLRLLNIDGLTEYKVEKGKILCDESSLNLRYLVRNETLSEWDALAIEVLVQYIAWQLSWPLTKSNTTRSEQYKILAEVLRAAKGIDAQEEPGDEVGDFPFLNVRG